MGSHKGIAQAYCWIRFGGTINHVIIASAYLKGEKILMILFGLIVVSTVTMDKRKK